MSTNTSQFSLAEGAKSAISCKWSFVDDYTLESWYLFGLLKEKV